MRPQCRAVAHASTTGLQSQRVSVFHGRTCCAQLHSIGRHVAIMLSMLLVGRLHPVKGASSNCTDGPWRLVAGEDCEVDEDGCVQTIGYPGNYSNSAYCHLVARLGGYILDRVDFTTEAGADTLEVNSVAYSGDVLKKVMVLGHIYWSSDATVSSAGWRVCPRSSCATFVCPSGYAPRPDGRLIGCAGLECDELMDLDTCCVPLCQVPPDLSSRGYKISWSPSGCGASTPPYAGNFTEADCVMSCAANGWRFEDGHALECREPGGTFELPVCAPERDGAPAWEITGACERYSTDCVQSSGFPSGYQRGCELRLPGDFEISAHTFDLEETFDYLELPGGIQYSGSTPPEPFVLPPDGAIQFVADGSVAGRGFRLCARPLCLGFGCPEGYVFDCDKLNTPCMDVYCEDATYTCCRNATAEELTSQAAIGTLSSAFTEGCITPTTTTTTTTSTTRDSNIAQIWGYATLSVPRGWLQNHSITVAESWQKVLSDITDSSLDDTWIVEADVPPDPLPDLVSWRIGCQVHYAEAAFPAFEAESLPQLSDRLQAELEAILPGSTGMLGEIEVIENVGGTDILGAYIYRSERIIFCSDFNAWTDDKNRDCSFHENFCTRWSTSNGQIYYDQQSQAALTFDELIVRDDPAEPTAADACCYCGGGICSAGTFMLRESPKFCAPCTKGYRSVGADRPCTACTPGRYNSVVGYFSCFRARGGHYVPGRAAARDIPCPAGSFADGRAMTACEDCLPGTFSSSSGSRTCSQCEPGSFNFDLGSTACRACPDGFFSEEGATNCSTCPAGTTSAVGSGSSACSDCPPGRVAPFEAAEDCDDCSAGQYASLPGQLECDDCKPSYVASQQGMTECSLCPAGQESNVVGATSCDDCGIGMYKEAGEQSCNGCPQGHYTISLGSTACNPCVPGTRAGTVGSTSCVECGHGLYTDSFGTVECFNCPLGRFDDAGGVTACSLCSPGRLTWDTGNTMCEMCPNGTYGPSAGTTACIECEPGFHAAGNGQTWCDACSAGTHSSSSGMSACTSCAAGRFTSVIGLSECLPCREGRFAEADGAAICQQCQRGRFVGGIASTICTACGSMLPGPSNYWTTWALEDGIWTETDMATNISACGCIPGTQPDGQTNINYVDGGPPEDPVAGRGHGCRSCGEGLVCYGMGKLRISAGYAWDGKLGVYDCTKAVQDACSGGLPGQCAPGRNEAKVACAECQSGKIGRSDGSCEDCGGSDYGLAIFLLLLLTFGAGAGYFYYDHCKERRIGHTTLLLIVAAGQLVNILQQLGVIAAIRVEWEDPIADVFDTITALGFLDINMLRPACVVDMRPVRTYAMRVVAVYVSLAFVVLVHLLSHILQHRHRVQLLSRLPVLLCALGTIIMAFFVTILTTMLGPMQCESHPNDAKTVSWFPSVLCWDSQDHTVMVIVGVSACSMPLLFLASAIWAAKEFPRKLLAGRRRFLSGWAFLFFRYHSSAYWYGPVLLMRNAIICVAPTLQSAAAQVLLLQTTMLCSIIVTARVMPWRAFLGNCLDVLTHFVLIMIVAVAAFFMDDSPGTLLSVFALLIMMSTLVLAFGLAGFGLFKIIFRVIKKPYQFFLCHHKVGAGCFARFLKMKLIQSRVARRKVFIDTDDLRNLDTLFDTVAHETETLVALHSSGLLLRPWCLGELATAHRSQVPIQVVRMSAVEPPSHIFITTLHTVVHLELLNKYGLTPAVIEETLQYFAELPSWSMPLELQVGVVLNLTAALAMPRETSSRDLAAGPNKAQEVAEDGCLLILAETHDLEAASSAFILRDLLQPIIAVRQQIASYVLPMGLSPPKEVQRSILICSTNVFASRCEVFSELSARDGLIMMPVLCGDSFSFPTKEALKAIPHLQEQTAEKADHVCTFIQAIFTEIAVDFKPAALSQTEAVLNLRAELIASRLWSDMKPVMQRGSARIATTGSTLQRKAGSSTHSNAVEEPLANAEADQADNIVTLGLDDDEEEPLASAEVDHADNTVTLGLDDDKEEPLASAEVDHADNTVTLGLDDDKEEQQNPMAEWEFEA